MKNIVIGNWKMNPATIKEAKKIFNAIKKGVNFKNTEVVVCPPFLYLTQLTGLPLGSQNSFWENEGAFTGEVSPLMIKNLGVEYVILGHSERREHLLENNFVINRKIKKAIENGLKVIFCIGETKKDWDEHKKPEVLETQLTEGLKGVGPEEIKNITIAYEPVWAVGTGNNCSVDETEISINFIKKIIAELYGKEAPENIRIIYGGSVNSQNYGDYVKSKITNGFLIGGASLNPEEFLKIIDITDNR